MDQVAHSHRARSEAKSGGTVPGASAIRCAFTGFTIATQLRSARTRQ